jgi:putative ABC transport system permease protein
MMLLDNLQFTLRYLKKDKITTSIHIAGLSFGISICILIALFIHHQRSFDSFHSQAPRIYRVNSVFNEGGMSFNIYATPLPLAGTLRSDLVGIESVAMIRPLFKVVVEANHKLFKEDRVLIASPELFDVFSIPMVSGDGRA